MRSKLKVTEEHKTAAMKFADSKALMVSQSVQRVLRGQHVRLRWLRGLSLACMTSMYVPVTHAELPVICVSCANGTFVSSGAAAQPVIVGNNMTINQTSASATFNWQSFNISSGSSVRFIQPDSSAVALNRIYQGSASQIFGSLSANGRVYLLNQNGIVFGSGAQVNVAGLIASSLDIAPEALNADGSTFLSNAVLQGAAAFKLFGNGASGNIHVEQGANIVTTEGGQVLMFAPNITNEGIIRTPGGQTALAAGESVYLTTPENTQGYDYLRGVVIEVGSGGGLVTNGNAGNKNISDPAQLVGQIIAERGNVTLAGLAVNQLGRITATTSIKQGGSIRLVAGAGTTANASASQFANIVLGQGGDLRLGEGSHTEVLLDTSGEVVADSSTQPQSKVNLDGRNIVMEQRAAVVAPHGDVSFLARENRTEQPDQFTSGSTASGRIYLANGSLIDVAGAEITKPVASNIISVELRGDELADSELQRNGALRGKTVQIDVRQSGTLSDGTQWVGSPIGNLQGYVQAVARDVNERNLSGGSIKLQSQGDVILEQGSTINISGGSINYTGGYVSTSSLLGADGKVYDISAADPSKVYLGLTDTKTFTVSSDRWGVSRAYTGSGTQATYEAGYIEGKDAGSLTILGKQAVLDGAITANTRSSRYQRNLATTIVNAALPYRPYTEMPLSGLLIMGQTSGVIAGNGSDYVLSDVSFTNSNAAALPVSFDPWMDVLSADFNVLSLRTRLFGDGSIGRLVLRANGVVTLPDVALVMPNAGSVDIKAGAVNIDGQLTAHSGSVKLTSAPTQSSAPLAGGITLGNTARLDVSGLWVNDSALANNGALGSASLATKGGNVSLIGDQNKITLATGSVIDVSAGAQFTASGVLKAGKAGAIAIATSPELTTAAATPLVLEGELRGYGFSNGGSLALTTGAVCITASAACLEDSRDGLLRLDPTFFRQGGFSNYALTSNQGGVELTANTQVLLQQNNFITQGEVSSIVTGTPINSFTSIALLPDSDRQAVNLSLFAAPTQASNSAFNAASFAGAANLSIGSHAAIRGEAGAKIALSSTTRLLVDGTVDAPAGSVSLHLTAGLILANSADAYFRDQGIWLGDNAQLLARGVSRIQNDALGRTVGSVLNGGTVSIDADRGHVLASMGSSIDVSGTSATLDIKQDLQGNYVRSSVASAGGTVKVEAAEGMVLGGTLLGKSGAPGKVAAGTLAITLDANGRGDPGLGGATNANAFPDSDSTIVLSRQSTPVVFSNASLPNIYQGKALLFVDQINAGGFDALGLTARSYLTDVAGVFTLHHGTIAFAGDLSLQLGRRIDLDAAVFSSDGGNARVSAPVVTLGRTDLTNGAQDLATAGSGVGSLSINAGQLDIIGNSVLQGIANAELSAQSDLRVQGVLIDNQLTGSLSTPGNLTLAAAQLYPTTLSKFTLNAGTASDNVLTIKQTGAAATALSAAGQLKLHAGNIVQAGTIKAPFGSIIFDAPNITLADGSVTSTSGGGASVLFGETQGGFDWVYGLGSAKTLVFGVGNQPLPTQQVTLQGDHIDFAKGSIIDVSGGGQLLASEFIAGTTGKLDVLGEDNSNGSFAVLPASKLAAAAYDYAIYKESGFVAGQSVYLAGNGQLPAGEYLMLPAKYALLPGAYLVRQVDGYQDITLGERYSLTNGATVVAGYYTSTGTALRDARNSGFVVQAGSSLQSKARYDVTSADKFFTAQAQVANFTAQRLPKDAGTVSFVANTDLTLDGNLRANISSDGRGAALDIASASLRIVADGDDATAAGVLSLRASALSSLGAESILLGGTRSETGAGMGIDTVASKVVMATDATLSAPEVMLAASDTVQVLQGATIATRSGHVEARDISLLADGAFLRVANSQAARVERTNTIGNAGQLQLDAGSLLSAAAGSITLESSKDASLQGTLSAQRGELSITGEHIQVSEVPGVGSGLVLSAQQLSSLSLDKLVLNSRGAIEFTGNTALSVANLDLQAQQFTGVSNSSARLDASGDIALTGINGFIPDKPTDAAGSGQLIMSAQNLKFNGGGMKIAGFASSTVNAQQQVIAAKDTQLSVDGALLMMTNRLTTKSGVDLDVTVGDVATISVSSSGTSLNTVTDLGGSLTLNADAINLNTRIELPSGLVKLNSTAETSGGVVLGSQAQIDLSGRSTQFGPTVVGSRGGTLSIDTRSGDLSVASGAVMDVSAGGAAAAGSITLRAANGTLNSSGQLRGHALDWAQAGSFSADAQSLTDFTALNRQLNAGGFNGERSLRQRGVGDLVVAAGVDNELRGSRVNLIADQGSVQVQGSVRAHDVQGGRVAFSARDGIVVNGSIDASAADSSERNGRIDLSVSQGGVIIGDSAVIATIGANAATGSAADGSINLRVQQATLDSVLDTDSSNDTVRLGGDWSAAGQVKIEGFKAYTDLNGSIDANDVLADVSNPYFSDAQDFANKAAAIKTALGNGNGRNIDVVSGIEIRSDANLSLDADWDLSAWRFNGQPGVLTLRSAGDLIFNETLSDGFAGVTGANAFRLTTVDPAWSYKLIAGADMSSADTLSTQVNSTGALSVIAAGDATATGANNTMIRTGTGSIDIRAAGDVKLVGEAATIYTAGLATDGTVFARDARLTNGYQLNSQKYPANGGDITVSAGRDIIGAATTQLVTDWLWRIGNDNLVGGTRSTAWTVNFASFHQGIATLGGGDIRTSAGRHVQDLSLSAPSVGRQTGSVDASNSQLAVIGGGDINLAAGGDITGGAYYAGRGHVQLDGQGSIGVSGATALAPILALGDAQAKVLARKNLTVETALNPTLLPQGASQAVKNAGRSYFSTYSDTASVALESTAGDIAFIGAKNTQAIADAFTTIAFDDNNGLPMRLLPGTLSMLATRGDLNLDTELTLLPSTKGGLNLRAYGDVNLNNSFFTVSDMNPALLAGINTPKLSFVGVTDSVYQALTGVAATTPEFNAAVPVRYNAAASGQLASSQIIAATGDVKNVGGSAYFGAPVEVYAGRDVIDLNIVAQNLVPGSVSSVTAGRDLRYSINRTAAGLIDSTNNRQLTVDGPGQLAIVAGRDVNLQASSGITTRGDLVNPALAANGADISVLAGLNGQAVDYAGFTSKYLAGGSSYQGMLSSFLTELTGIAPASEALAMAAFVALDAQHQAILLQRILLAELRESAKYAASDDPQKNGDYSRGFAALDAMFPGSGSAANPYHGDINLYFSRIYTRANGDITLLTPGGGVNAGLATPPAALGITKPADQLGVVTQRGGNIGIVADKDLQVNESRIFAIDDSDILVWSSNGDIDAGRGAKTAISAPSPIVSYDGDAHAIVTYAAALAGSGIQTRASTAAYRQGEVVLAAPRGVVNAGDAGIVAGNLTIAATAVLGADNIKVTGVAVGVPVDTGGLGASLAGVTNTAGAASSAATAVVGGEESQKKNQAPLTEAALSWLEVFVVGLGEDNCRQDDVECLKKQK